MRYPIDQQTTETFLGHLVAHDRAQRQMVQALSLLLKEAMGTVSYNDEDDELPDWYKEADKFIKLQDKIKLDHDNRLFNEKNGISEKQSSIALTPEIANNSSSTILGVNTMITDPEQNKQLNKQEASFGEELSENDIASHFNERPRKKKSGVDLSEKTPFKYMTLEQINEWERKQDNSNDIYKVKARVSNLARGSGASLTPVGEALCNSFVHVLKSLYDFAETIPDKSLRISLIEKIKSNEGMPGTLIAAMGVKTKP
jgi:hypothetical protein